MNKRTKYLIQTVALISTVFLSWTLAHGQTEQGDTTYYLIPNYKIRKIIKYDSYGDKESKTIYNRKGDIKKRIGYYPNGKKSQVTKNRVFRMNIMITWDAKGKRKRTKSPHRGHGKGYGA